MNCSCVKWREIIECKQCNMTRKKNTPGELVKQKKQPRTNYWRCGCDFVVDFKFVVLSFTVERSDSWLKTGKDQQCYQISDQPEWHEGMITKNYNFKHANGCVPSYQQYIIGARIAGLLLDKENEFMDRLLTVVELLSG